MTKFIIFLLFLITINYSFGQTVVETLPKTFWCPNDTFTLAYKNYSKFFPYKVSREDKESPGTDAALNEYATIYYGNDSIRLNYNNKLPYAHIIYINFASPKGKTTLRFHYNDVASYFPTPYMEKNLGNIQFDVPEIYELANIIWTLSPSGQNAKDLNKGGQYYQRVNSYFKQFLNHPIFNALNFADSMYAKEYYDFRENSFAFNFQKPTSTSNTKLLFNGPYYFVYGDELADSSLFGKLKPLVEDFAMKTKFRKFYKDNTEFYQNQIKRQKELLPVKQMWTWLETEFPKTKYQSYRVVFSPLIGGSHSTQRYSTRFKSDWFSENVMFICNTDRVDEMSQTTEKQKEALMSGIVFTEIDHNYVNPVTNKYNKRIDSIFSNRTIWTNKGNSSDFYESTIGVFNEYMTWAVFCLYIADTYDEETTNLVIAERETRMIDKRNFIKFKEFDQALLKIRKEHKNLKVVDLYPFILDWCKQQL